MRKTLEQERAFYCLKCIERLKLAKEGKWFDLRDSNNIYDLKPANFDEFHKYRFYDGVKKELYGSFVSWFMDGSKNRQLRNIIGILNRNEEQAKKKLKEFFSFLRKRYYE